MKKTLITVALAAIVAVPALAQDTATIGLSDATITIPSKNYALPTAAKNVVDNKSYSTQENDGNSFAITMVYDWADLNSSLSPNSTVTALYASADCAGHNGVRTIAFSKNEDGVITASASSGSGNAADFASFTLTSRVTTPDLSTYVSKDGKLVLTLSIYGGASSSNPGGGKGTLYIYNANATDDASALYTAGSDINLLGYKPSGAYYNCLNLCGASLTALDALYIFNDNLETGTDNLGTVNVLAVSKAAYNAAVPEPATATLSLLALAGLCARRRRK